MMCLWNAANGPSIHAELIGREWVRDGHKLTVYSPKRHPDARPTLQKDEEFVIRNFSVDVIIPFTRAAEFDYTPVLRGDYRVFVAQNVERLPVERLLKIFPEIWSSSWEEDIFSFCFRPKDIVAVLTFCKSSLFSN